MRSASSYRGAKKRAARESGVSFAKFNDHYARSRTYAANELAAKALRMTPEGAREVLGIWASNGGRVTAASPAASQSDLDAMNAKAKEVPPEAQVAAAAKITAEDVDKALEAALTRWQTDRRQGPLPLSKLFAARARALGWVENVEFAEEGK